jgi:hypothetical protein
MDKEAVNERTGERSLRAGAMDATKVVVAISGSVYVAPEGTVGPTTADSTLTAAWKSVGYLSEDAVGETINTAKNDIVAWQGATIVRQVITSFGVEYKFTMIETNKDSIELYYGKMVDAGGLQHHIGGGGGGRKSFIIDAIDSAGQHIRRYIPSGEVTDRGEVKLSGGAALGYEITLAAYPADGLGGDSIAVFYAEALT